MRILILGAAGMLGHKMYQVFSTQFETFATLRKPFAGYARFNVFDETQIVGGVDAFNIDSATRAIAVVQPDVVVNCIGVVKQLEAANDPITALTINALFPHRVAQVCWAGGIRFIHISTDCVFNGRGSMYSEDDPSDAEDLYGRTKFLGEVDYPGCLTVRTSIIGRELNSAVGLVEWFLSNRGGQVRGFRKAIYSGFTTGALATIITDIVQTEPGLSGVYQVSSEPINKYELLMLIRDAYRADIEIDPDDDFHIDRSLDSSRFRAKTAFAPPSWPQMIQTMADDPTPYDTWREQGV